jgi:hypothetical protein
MRRWITNDKHIADDNALMVQTTSVESISYENGSLWTTIESQEDGNPSLSST